MTNWKLLTESTSLPFIKKFANDELSMKKTTQAFTNTKFAGEFRTLVRKNGTQYARRLARKALRRRDIEV